MNREIIFKAKTEMIVRTYNNGLDDGEWVQGYLRCDCGMWLIYQFEYDRADQVAYEVNPETICQWTGLKDRNGNKVWENDILKDFDDDMLMVVRWDNEEIRFVLDGYGTKGAVMEYGYDENAGGYGVVDIYGFDDFYEPINAVSEVIGNIFDNPELLKQS